MFTTTKLRSQGRSRRPSASFVISIVALVMAMGGTAMATQHFLLTSKSQISPKLLNALKGNRGLRGPAGVTGPAGPAGATGPAGPAGPGARWALISPDHKSILAQSGGISIAAGAGNAGVYLDMGANVNGKVIEATPAYTDNDPGTKGPVEVTICGNTSPYGSTCQAPGTDDTRHVWVYTENKGGTLGENHAVYVAVF